MTKREGSEAPVRHNVLKRASLIRLITKILSYHTNAYATIHTQCRYVIETQSPPSFSSPLLPSHLPSLPRRSLASRSLGALLNRRLAPQDCRRGRSPFPPDPSSLRLDTSDRASNFFPGGTLPLAPRPGLGAFLLGGNGASSRAQVAPTRDLDLARTRRTNAMRCEKKLRGAEEKDEAREEREHHEVDDDLERGLGAPDFPPRERSVGGR